MYMWAYIFIHVRSGNKSVESGASVHLLWVPGFELKSLGLYSKYLYLLTHLGGLQNDFLGQSDFHYKKFMVLTFTFMSVHTKRGYSLSSPSIPSQDSIGFVSLWLLSSPSCSEVCRRSPSICDGAVVCWNTHLSCLHLPFVSSLLLKNYLLYWLPEKRGIDSKIFKTCTAENLINSSHIW